MAQTNFTPISLYYSATAAAVPTAGNLVAGELAINTADGKLFYKDSAGVVQTIASKDVNSGTFTNISVSGVASFADGTVSLPSITNIGDTNTGIFFPAADTIAFTEGGVEAMRINSSAYVGIGTTTPATKLVVKGTHVGGEGLINIIADAGTQFAALSFTNNVTQKGIVFHDNTNNLFYLYGAAGQGLAFNSNDAERMRIDSSGNVGIGTTAPATKLEINGNGELLRFDGSAGQNRSMYFRNVSTSNTAKIFTDGIMTIGSNAVAPVTFITQDAERMRLTSGGSLLVGSTNNNANLYVEKTDDGNTFGARNTFASYTATVGFFGANRNTTNNTFWFIDCYNYGAGAYKFRVADSGNATNTNGSYGTISDVKLKENIVDATSKLDKVNQLQVRNYNFIGDDLKQIGFVAQEFEQVFPSMVEESVDKDVDGNDLGTTTKTIKTTVLIPILVKAIQEQQALIENLTTRLNALEGK